MADSPADELRAEEFLVAYNAIDRFLRSRLDLDRHSSFRSVVDRYASKHPWWRRDAEALRAFAELRNVIVHERFERFKYISIPAQEVVAEISAIRDRLISPKTVQNVAGRDVFTVDAAASLADLLRLVEEKRINQLPVYGAGRFQGLVTSIGCARLAGSELRSQRAAARPYRCERRRTAAPGGGASQLRLRGPGHAAR